MPENKPAIPVYAIVAMDAERAIGKDGGLPWHIPADLKNFSKLTKGHTVLMGRKTFDSLPEKYKPLPHRLNLVLSRDPTPLDYKDTRKFSDINDVAEFCSKTENILGQALWVIGGQQIFNMTSSWWDKVYLTKIAGTHEGDVFFPKFEDQYTLLESTPDEGCIFEEYARKDNLLIRD